MEVPAHAQAQPARPAQPAQPQSQQPTFRSTAELVTTDVIVRDSKSDQFMADLKPTDFDVFEDGVKQELASMVLIHGGRAYNTLAPPPAPLQEGIILPVSRPTNDAAGRVFLLFVDDLHMDFQNTPRIREIFRKMLKNLIHDGDMWGMVSTGTSSISIDLTYDRALLDDAINRISGNGLKPTEIIKGQQGADGPVELQYRAHVAFTTANSLMQNLEKLHNRRKAVIWVSSGYDFNPFEKSRLKEELGPCAWTARMTGAATRRNSQQRLDPNIAGQGFAVRGRRARARHGGRDARRQPRKRDALHHRPARPRGGRRHRREPRSGGVGNVRVAHAGQPANDCGSDGRLRGGQPERLRQGAEADRRRDERLLRAGVLFEQS